MTGVAANFCDLQMGHVLFLDIVEYSLLAPSEQSLQVRQLQELVRRTCAFGYAEAAKELVRLPAGDGLALLFLRHPVAPAHCAIELSRAVRERSAPPLRMGIHAGIVQLLTDINGQCNAAGDALNFAQRVMNCGDANHILLSGLAADLLRQAGLWQEHLCDLGLCTVKHGERLQLFNLSGPDFGNPTVPTRLRQRDLTISHEAGSLLCRAPGAPNGAGEPVTSGRAPGLEPTPPPHLPDGPPEPDGGAVPLNSPFYVKRTADGELDEALHRQDSIILVKGARQMGKTSLLARGLDQARHQRCAVALTDFQKLSETDLRDADAFFRAVADLIAEALNLEGPWPDAWKPGRGPGVNFERFLRRQVLGTHARAVVWGLDEVDRLFSCPFGGEVFGLFRSWHNERALEPDGPWTRFTMVIAYATEAHLFITDLNQSPFNVGTRIQLDDFTLEQVADLNLRHGSPLRSAAELARFYRLVGGQPFLVRAGLHQMVAGHLDVAAFEDEALRDDGFFGDHLRRLLVLLGREAGVTDALRAVLQGRPCPDPRSFYRLRSAGLISGDHPADAQPRCQMYALHLERHLR